MIIERIHILNYGKWHHVTIPLRKGLNILYGRNEAGKTTLLSFIKGVLFGYLQRRTSHKNYIPRNSKNYGGQLEVRVNGHEYIIKRMAGKNGGLLTILNSRGKRLENSRLKKILGPFDRNTFNALYYFGTVNLKQIGKLKQRDLIYRIQRIGLAHSDDWINYREDLNKRAKQLYSPRGYRPALNQRLKHYSRLLDQVNDAKQGYRTYQSLLRRIQQFKLKQRTLNAKLSRQSERARQLSQDQDTWTRYQKLESLARLVNQPAASGFTDTDAQQLQTLIDRLNHVKDRVELIHQQASEASSQRINDDQLSYYRKHHQVINELAERFNSVQGQIERLRLMERKNVDAHKQLKRLVSKNTVNGRRLVPLSNHDYSALKQILHKARDNQKSLQILTQQMVNDQKITRFTRKDYLIYGISGLLMIVGLITVIPLSGLGLILGVSWLIDRSFHLRKRRISVAHVQSQINSSQKIKVQMGRKVQYYQERYHYPTESIEHWLGMQDNLQLLTKLRTDVQAVKVRKERLTDQLNSYFKRWTFINRQLTLSPDLIDRLQQLKNYVNKMDRAAKLNQQARTRYRKYLDRLKNVQRQESSYRQQLITFYHNHHIKDVDDFRAQQQRQKELVQQRRLYNELSKQIGPSEVKTLHNYSTYDDLQATVDQVNRIISDLQARSRTVSSQKAADQARLRQLVRNGSYDELQQRIANARTVIDQSVKRWLEESLASQWINTALNLATKGRVPKIERQARTNFRILTNQRYESIVFNKTKIKVMREDKQRFTLYELSKGTVQQLYLALVFAMAQVFSKDYPMPLLIDDGFTDFDVSRRKAAIKLLKSIGKGLQVVYCTSDENLLKHSNVIDLNQL